jgi:hypothetical protein
MGLGKTLSMIALAASDADNPQMDDASTSPGVLGEDSNGVTLIIVPPPCKCDLIKLAHYKPGNGGVGKEKRLTLWQ